MIDEILTKQLAWLQALHNARPVFLDPLFQAFNYLDTTPAYLCMCTAILLYLGWKAGLNILIFTVLGINLNTVTKAFFALPRPSTIDPSLALSTVSPGSYGFPSGGAMGSLMIATVLYYYFPRRSVLIFGIFYTLLISFSRVYLGVHFFTDILGGWVLAVLYSFIYFKVLKKLIA